MKIYKKYIGNSTPVTSTLLDPTHARMEHVTECSSFL